MRKNTFTFEYGDPRCHASFVGIDCGEVRTSFSIHRYLAGVYADRFDESCLILNTKTGEFVKRVEPGILASNPQTAPRLNRHPSAEELIRTLNAISANVRCGELAKKYRFLTFSGEEPSSQRENKELARSRVYARAVTQYINAVLNYPSRNRQVQELQMQVRQQIGENLNESGFSAREKRAVLMHFPRRITDQQKNRWSRVIGERVGQRVVEKAMNFGRLSRFGR